MRHHTSAPRDLTDDALIARIHHLAREERAATAELVLHLGEFDARRLYLGEGCSSLFTYCTDVLHFSEHAAYNRIAAARASRRFPVILDRLADGSIHLTAVTLLAPHLTKENHEALLREASRVPKRDFLRIVARFRPREVVAGIRKLPARDAATERAAGSRDLFAVSPDRDDVPETPNSTGAGRAGGGDGSVRVERPATAVSPDPAIHPAARPAVRLEPAARGITACSSSRTRRCMRGSSRRRRCSVTGYHRATRRRSWTWR